ncbi:MAG TPA: S9 family peptidase [Thermomicrobiales bacterium]|nr:S9 family peptidase [Thermomicrobiales bacterium]
MLSVDELLSFRGVTDARISPDGRRVAFVVQAPLAGEHAKPEGSRIWLVDAAGGDTRQLTQGPGRDIAPAWSPDGSTLAFLSERAEKGTARLYLLPLDGGEARALDTPTGAVKKFAWSPDGARIAFLRTDKQDDAAGEGQDKGDEKNAPVVFEEEPRYDRLWLVDVGGGAARRATEADAQVWEFAWLPDGRALAVVVADEPTAAAWYRCRLARLDLDGGALTTLYAPPVGRQVARPAPSPDGRSVAFVSCAWSDPGMSGGDLWVVPAGGGSARNLTPGLSCSINTATWRPDGAALLCDAYDDNEDSVGLVRAGEASGWERLWRGPVSFGYGGISVAADGATFAARRDDAREPGDVWLGRVAGGEVAWMRLTDLHAGSREALTLAFEDVRWRAADGLEIGGLLLRPAGAAGPAPLVTIVHGGPTGMSGHGFSARGLSALAPLLASRGIAVLLPNYRGSNGRGVAFAEADHRDMGGGEFTDVLAGVDHLVATGVADPARLGIGGWSYGGYMTMWAVTQTDRFKVAVAGAGIANWLSFHGGSILHAWDRFIAEADPYAPDGLFTQRSPIYATAHVTTPTLILHGDADRDVPPGQSHEFYRALKDRGVETRLVLYPGAPHGPREPRHIRDVLERSLAWFTERL